MKITAIAKKPVGGKIKTAPIGTTHSQIKGRGEHGFSTILTGLVFSDVFFITASSADLRLDRFSGLIVFE